MRLPRAYIDRIHYIAGDTGERVWNNPFLTAAYSIFTNFKLILWPDRLTLYHSPYTIHQLLLKIYVVLFVILLVSLPFIFKKSRVLFFGIMIFMLYLAPTFSPLIYVVCCGKILVFPIDYP